MDLLSDILVRLQVEGTLYFRTSFTSPWSIQVPAYRNVARFHFAHKGNCHVRVGSERSHVLLEHGDLLIIPAGATHTLTSDPALEDDTVQLDQVVDESGFSGQGALVYGELGTDLETQLVCGHFSFGEHASHPLIESLPSHIHIKNYGDVAGYWMEGTLRLIGAEAGRSEIGGEFIALRMAEIIFAQALRTFFLTDGTDIPVFAAFTDPHVAPVLAAIHEDPSQALTLESLSSIAGMSRTSFVNRFTRCMSMSPLQYITNWRIQIARQQLAQSSMPIIEIAESIGYKSEAAFGRVFKKHLGVAPATYRRELRA